jgi:hypothetical protein
VEIGGQRFEHLPERAVLDPPLKASMTGLKRRIPRGEIFPGRARAENPQDAVQHVPRIAPGPTPSVPADPWSGQERRENRPLGVSQVHALRYDAPQDFIHNPVSGFMR